MSRYLGEIIVVYWIIGIIIVIAIVAFTTIKINRRKCLLAFGEGVVDVGKLPWKNIVEKYNSYLSPMRPMDAAAYQRGLEYALLSTQQSGWQDMKKDFSEAYSSGGITREGTVIRKQGAESAARLFRLRIPQQLEELIINNPEMPPIVAKAELEDAKNT